jgi:septum formation topological specificity factor MinE
LAEGFCEKFAIWSTFFVFVGLVIEGYIAYEHPQYDTCLERWGSFGADILVALGVLGELLPSMFGRVYRSELARRSNAKLEDANVNAAQANERAASLEKDAAEARLETQRLKAQIAWRRLSKQQSDILVATLKNKPMKVCLEWVDNDPESVQFSDDIYKALETAGIELSVFHGYERAVGFGISLGLSENGQLLRMAFAQIGLGLADHVPSFQQLDTIHFLVGTKGPMF